jgi:trimeric autotransporter adhesin
MPLNCTIRKQILILLTMIFISLSAFCQSLAINSTGAVASASAILDVSSANKGLLVPRMTATQRIAIASPANGLLLYDNDSLSFAYFNGTTWNFLKGTNNINGAWGLQGNSGTTASSFVGTTDAQDLRFKVNSIKVGFLNQANSNITFGENGLLNNTSGFSNIAIGAGSLKNNTNRSNLVAIGDSALFSNGIGAVSFNDAKNNVAIGSKALFENTVGSSNTAIGSFALQNNGIGYYNTAVGTSALANNTFGISNTAFGHVALQSSTQGSRNTAVGDAALIANNTGNDNTAMGNQALYNVVNVNNNTAIGSKSLLLNNGNDNTAIGFLALGNNFSGSGNTAIGNTALIGNSTGNNITAIGNGANVLGSNLSNATAIGYNAKVSASNSLVLGGTGGEAVNVGVGNTSPPNTFTINYTGTVATTITSYAFAIQQAGSTDITLGSNSNAFLQTWNSKPLLINSQGNNVGIGLSTTPSAKLDVNGALLVESAQSTHAQGVWLEWNKDGGSGKSYLLNQKGLGSGGFVFGEVDNANAITQRFVIDNVGNASFFGSVSASCGTLVCSDIRYKKDIEPLQNSLSKILQLNSVSYYFKTEAFKEKNFTNSKQVGLIAQELERIYPEMVSTDKDGYKNVNYTQLIPVLIEGIKTLQKEIDDLKQKIK